MNLNKLNERLFDLLHGELFNRYTPKKLDMLNVTELKKDEATLITPFYGPQYTDGYRYDVAPDNERLVRFSFDYSYVEYAWKDESRMFYDVSICINEVLKYAAEQGYHPDSASITASRPGFTNFYLADLSNSQALELRFHIRKRF